MPTLRRDTDGPWENKSESVRLDLTALQESISSLSRVGVSVYRTKEQSVPNNTWVRVGFNQVDGEDLAHIWQGDFRLIVPVAGRYSLIFQTPYSSSGSGDFYAKVSVNNLDVQGSGHVFSAATAASLTFGVTRSYNLGDIISVLVLQNSGGLLTIGSTASAFYIRASFDQVM